jgi:hypothetical protein
MLRVKDMLIEFFVTLKEMVCNCQKIKETKSKLCSRKLLILKEIPATISITIKQKLNLMKKILKDYQNLVFKSLRKLKVKMDLDTFLCSIQRFFLLLNFAKMKKLEKN